MSTSAERMIFFGYASGTRGKEKKNRIIGNFCCGQSLRSCAAAGEISKKCGTGKKWNDGALN